MKAEFLQLAHTFDPAKHNIAGWYVSTKLDGERALWDGGISRGLLASEVPYANTVKDDRLLVAPVATGLWSRTGKVIHAPDFFLDQLPPYPLDGELYNGRGGFQDLRKIVGKHEPDDRWHLINYYVFDSPSFDTLFAPRRIKVRNEYEYPIEGRSRAFADARRRAQGTSSAWNFEFVLRFLSKAGRFADTQIVAVGQQRLPLRTEDAIAYADDLAKEEVENGGEGVMLRSPSSYWEPYRSHFLLKHKPWSDDEATIVGFIAGKVGKHGTLAGKIGAILVDWQGTRFKIGSGMTHDIREFEKPSQRIWAIDHPGEVCPDGFNGKTLRLDSTITFKYRECSDDGVPKEARYWRERNDA